MAVNSFIGAVIAVSANTPATVDGSGFAALTYTTVGLVTSFGAVGDSSEAINYTTLAGRTYHLNGAKDGGEVQIGYAYESAGDSGQTIIKNGSNGSTTHSFKITDPDGKITYFHCLLANLQHAERTPQNHKGMTFIARVNSPLVEV